MTKQQNTDGKFWAYQNVASAPDGSGKFRASIVRFSDIYNWSPDDLAEGVERADNHSRLIGPLTREEWDALEPREARLGYCDTPDANAPITFGEWVPMY